MLLGINLNHWRLLSLLLPRELHPLLRCSWLVLAQERTEDAISNPPASFPCQLLASFVGLAPL